MSFVSRFAGGVLALNIAFGLAGNPACAGEDVCSSGCVDNNAYTANYSGNTYNNVTIPSHFLQPGYADPEAQRKLIRAIKSLFPISDAGILDEVLKRKLEHWGCSVGNRFNSETYVQACDWRLDKK